MTLAKLSPLSSSAVEAELERIGAWWLRNAIDNEQGGFFGEIDNSGNAIAGAPKNVILNTRILWFFSEAALFTGKAEYRDAADRAFNYILDHFVDADQGGLFWEVDASGKPVKLRKQTYGQAFGIYSLSAYFRLSKDKRSIELAKSIFDRMELHAKWPASGGYVEAFSSDWQELDDMRLSEVDANSPLSMNNHLHVLEAYTALLQIKDDKRVSKAVVDLLELFRDRIIGPNSSMGLFFDFDWQPMCGTTSCGHDIEASWLLLEAGNALNDPGILAWLEPLVLEMAHQCLRVGFHDGRYVINEIEEDGEMDTSSPWWVQAEALVGFLHMNELSGEAPFLDAARAIWVFIQEQHLDYENGEWLWDARQDPVSAHRDYKAGAWKGPYHNGRSMMEAAKILRRMEARSDGRLQSSLVDSSHG